MGDYLIKPATLVAWLETDGWMRIKIRPANHNITVEIGFSQKDLETLEKLAKAIELTPSRSRSKGRHQITYTTQKIDHIINILDKADREDWFTTKYEDYQHFKRALSLIKEVRKRKTSPKWFKEDIRKLLKIRKQMKHIRKPWNKLPDREILQGWKSKLK